ncbi:DUF4367 domain-containing protein [Bengtsoniella intestinalis]|uniref:DUF4367 domain-containing protein n=1 Tax=Bengtsoniella intestinalis TaxID=3073143 RepID=UPI00391F1D6B
MMNQYPDHDSILQIVGESLVEQESAPVHTFSHGYETKKKELLQTMTKSSRKRRPIKRMVTLIAAALALTTLTAFAYSFLFQPEGTRTPSTGDYAYDNNIQSFVDVYAAQAKISVPTRYTENEDGKYHYTAPDGTEYGISVRVETMYNPLFATHASEVETLDINGIPGELIAKNGSQYCNILNLFYENSGHVVTIYTTEDVTRQELLDMAEGVELTIDYDTVWYTAEDYQRDQAEAETATPPQMNVVPLGTQMVMDTVGYTVEEIRLLDTLPTDLSEDAFATRSEDAIAPYMDETGGLKPFERVLSIWDEDTAQLVTTRETVDLKIVEVLLTVENLDNTAITEVAVCPRLSYGDESLWADSAVQADDLPFYFDQSDYVGTSQFYFMDMAQGETTQVRLLFALAQDRVNDGYVTFGMDSDTRYDVKIG